MCADLGARTIREELDAMRVMGINPIQALVVPRVLARPWSRAAVVAGHPRGSDRRLPSPSSFSTSRPVPSFRA